MNMNVGICVLPSYLSLRLDNDTSHSKQSLLWSVTSEKEEKYE